VKKRRVRNVFKAQQIAQTVSQAIQKQVHDQIATVVSRCLKTVFTDPYEFRIEFDKKRGKTEARLVFVRDGEEYDPQEGAGIGVMDVAAFALRLACLLLQRPKRRRLIVADEPFRCVSKEYRGRIAQMVSALAEEFDFQFIFVTHDQEFELGRVVRLP
jgi:DNA repair exonuclease SbcCD ATPase subunit